MVSIEKNNEKFPEYMRPTNDILFKKIFGADGNEQITKDLVSSILGKNIKKLEFKNPDLLRENLDDKNEVLDVRALLDNDTLCDIEVQVINYHDIDKRVLDYWAKMYRTSIHKGDKDYLGMKKTIIILISAFEVDNLKEVEDYHTVYKIIEEKHQKVLTDVFEVDIIELPKAKEEIEKGTFKEVGNLKKWIRFFIDPFEEGKSKMEEMPEEIKKAYEELQKLNANEAEREIAERRYMDLLSLEYAKKYEREEEKKEIAKGMLKMNFEINVIAELTGLTKEEIENLK